MIFKFSKIANLDDQHFLNNQPIKTKNFLEIVLEK